MSAEKKRDVQGCVIQRCRHFRRQVFSVARNGVYRGLHLRGAVVFQIVDDAAGAEYGPQDLLVPQKQRGVRKLRLCGSSQSFRYTVLISSPSIQIAQPSSANDFLLILHVFSVFMFCKSRQSVSAGAVTPASCGAYKHSISQIPDKRTKNIWE